MSSKSNIASAPVQLGQPQFPVRHGTVLYQLLESSSKESNRICCRISSSSSSSKPPPVPAKKPSKSMRRSNIPIPIGRSVNNSEDDSKNHRRFRNPNAESVEESNLIYGCKPVESRKFEESLRKYDNEGILSRPTTRSAPASRLPSPSPPASGRMRPATTITAEVRRALSKAKVSSFRESSAERFHGGSYNKEPERNRVPQYRPPPSPNVRTRRAMKTVESQTTPELVKIKLYKTIDTQTSSLNIISDQTLQESDEVDISESELNENADQDEIIKLFHDMQTQTEEIHNDTLEERREFIRLLQEKDELCAELADQLRDKISDCFKLQAEVESLNSELDSIMNINMGLQNKVLDYSKEEHERKSGGGDLQTVFVQTEAPEVIKLLVNKSTLTDVQVLSVSTLNTIPLQADKCNDNIYSPPDETDYDNSNLEEETPVEEIKLGRKSSLSAAKDWVDSSGPPFDFSSVQSFSAEKFMRTPSCSDATLPSFMPVKQVEVPDPEPHPVMVEFDRKSAEEKNLQVLKAAIEELEGIDSQPSVHTSRFIKRIQRRKDLLRYEEQRTSKMSEMTLNPEESKRTSKEGKAVSFNGEISESQEQLKAATRKSRRRGSRRRKSRSLSRESRYNRYYKSDKGKSKDEIDFSAKYSNKNWTPEEAERKRKMINEVFNALQLTPKTKIDDVLDKVTSHVIAVGIPIPNSNEQSTATTEHGISRPRPKRRELKRRSPTTCLLEKS